MSESKKCEEVNDLSLKDLRKFSLAKFSGKREDWCHFKYGASLSFGNIDERFSEMLKLTSTKLTDKSETNIAFVKRAATLLFGKLYDAMPSNPSHLKTLLETANLWTHGDADLVKSDHADFNKPLIDVAHPGFVWDLLTKRFERKNVVEKQNLTASLFLLRMAESSKPIEDFQNLHSNILDICMQLEHMGDPIPESIKRLVLTTALPKSTVLTRELNKWKDASFATLVDNLFVFFSESESSKDLPDSSSNSRLDLTPTTSVMSLGLRSKSANKHCSHCDKTGHTVDTCFKLHPCKNCGMRGHNEERCFSNSESSHVDSCAYCGSFGHLETDCRIKKRAEMMKQKRLQSVTVESSEDVLIF